MEEWRCDDCEATFWTDARAEWTVQYCPYCGTDSGAVRFVDMR
jgi:DNA-directed RNA polymerase subunit RPC12/RpoP